MTKLSFPLQLVIQIVALAIAAWAASMGLRSDVRDLSTRIELKDEIREKASTAMTTQLEKQGAAIRMLDLQMQELAKQMAVLSSKEIK